MSQDEGKSDIQREVERQGFQVHIVNEGRIPAYVYVTRGDYRSVQTFSWQHLRDTIKADDEWEGMSKRPKRTCFLISDDGMGGFYVTVPAEVITDKLNQSVSRLSLYSAPNERNIKDGMRHWHWTVEESRLPVIRQLLTSMGLAETSDLNAVW